MKQLYALVVLIVLTFAASPAVFSQLTKKSSVFGSSPFSKVDKIKPVQTVTPEVVFGAVDAYTDGNGVFVRWNTTSEVENIGFSVTRTQKGVTEKVGNFVLGSYAHYGKEPVSGETYSVFDPSGTSDAVYAVQAFLLTGPRTSSLTVSVKYTSSLTGIAGASGKSLSQNALATNGTLISNTPIYNKTLQEAINNSTLFPNLANQRTIAAQTGAKIGVKQTGIYRVTRAQLQAAGFDVNSDSSLWQLYTDGNEQSITIGPSGAYIEFFGKAVDTLESDTRMYYLIKGNTSGRRISSFALRPSFRAADATGYSQDSVLKERQNYAQNILNGPASNFFGDAVFSGGATTVNFDVTAIDRTSLTAHFVTRLQGFTGAGDTISFSLNGQSLGQVSGNAANSFVLDTTVPISSLLEGQNTLQITCTVCGSADFSFFDYLDIAYNRRYVALQNQLMATATPDFNTDVQGFTSPNIRMFDITNDRDPVQLTGLIIGQNGGTFDASLPAYKDSVIYTVEDSAILSPATVSANNPSTLATSNHNANLVIISYKDFLTQANAWANYRRGQGFSVEVVDVEDTYDEFNYGVLSAQSIKDFLLYARDNWQTAPGYVLLIGDATYDPRLFEGPPRSTNLNLVPSMFFDSIEAETPSDDALVDFNNDGLAELAIGRIPATTPDMVTNALNKTMSFETQAPTQNLSRGFLCHYDNPIGFDFQAMCQRMSVVLPPTTPVVFVGRADTNPNGPLVADMNNGRYVINFSGHGTTGSWASASNFQIGHVPMLTNANDLSIFMMLTCLNGYFVSTTNTSLAERLLNSTTGGAAASWASSGTTTPDVQEIMGTRFLTKLGEGTIPRMGDLIIDAKTVVPGGRDVRLSWALLGDPMLKVR